MASGDMLTPHTYRYQVQNDTSETISAGAFFVNGNTVFRALVDIAAGATDTCEGPYCGGVYECVTVAGQAWVVGQKVYRQTVGGAWSTSSASAIEGGIAARTKGASPTVGYVALLGA